MGIMNALFGSGSGSNKIKEMLENGAAIIDVRTPGEFQGGHVVGSNNVPLQTLSTKVDELKQLGKPLVLCCASGMRSGQATSFLKSEGIECENGGGWMKVNALVQ